MKAQEWISWALQALLLAVYTWGVSELKGLSTSVQELNVKMAVVVERDSSRSIQIDKLENRVEKLEHRN